MVQSRWVQRAGPGLLVILAIGLLRAGPAGADVRAWSPPDCGVDAATVAETARTASPGAAEPVAAPWYRLDAVLDDSLAVRGQKLALGLAGDADARTLDLSAESFAAGPFGGWILAGSDDGRVSELRLLDPRADCALTVATERAVIRRATLDPAGSAIYEFRVDRATRADLGVWRRPLDGSAPEQVLPALPVKAVYGPTFSTELSWTAESDRLVVQSCGELACRTRLIDPVSGTTTLVDDPHLGELVGVSADRLVAYAACRGLPCPLVAVDLGSLERQELVADSGVAVLVRAAGGARIVHEVGAGARPELRVVDLTGRELDRFAEPAGDLRLVPAPARARAGAAVPAGWIVLARNGRDLAPSGRSVVLRRLDSDRSVAIEEVAR